MRQVARANEFYMVAPRICGFLTVGHAPRHHSRSFDVASKALETFYFTLLEKETNSLLRGPSFFDEGFRFETERMYYAFFHVPFPLRFTTPTN